MTNREDLFAKHALKQTDASSLVDLEDQIREITLATLQCMDQSLIQVAKEAEQLQNPIAIENRRIQHEQIKAQALLIREKLRTKKV